MAVVKPNVLQACRSSTELRQHHVTLLCFLRYGLELQLLERTITNNLNHKHVAFSLLLPLYLSQPCEGLTEGSLVPYTANYPKLSLNYRPDPIPWNNFPKTLQARPWTSRTQ